MNLPSAIPNGELADIASDGRGFVAVGVRDPAGDPKVLVLESSDGTEWNEPTDLGSLGTAAVSAVAAGPRGRVVVGEIKDRPTALFDGGDGAWHPATLPQAGSCCVNDVASGTDWFVAVGASEPSATRPAQAEAWVSLDGRTWQPSKAWPHGAAAVVQAVAATSTGFTAIGWTAAADGQHTRVWTSGDGLTWTQALELAPHAKTFTGSLSVDPPGVVLGGSPFGNSTWTLTDGSTWTQAEVPGAGNDVFGIAQSGGRFIAVGRSAEGDQPGVIATRSSIDAPWVEVPPLPELAEALVVRVAYSDDGSTAVAVGNAVDERPVILVSPPG